MGERFYIGKQLVPILLNLCSSEGYNVQEDVERYCCGLLEN